MLGPSLPVKSSKRVGLWANILSYQECWLCSCHRHKLLETKRLCSWPWFCDFQMSKFNKLCYKSAEKTTTKTTTVVSLFFIYILFQYHIIIFYSILFLYSIIFCDAFPYGVPAINNNKILLICGGQSYCSVLGSKPNIWRERLTTEKSNHGLLGYQPSISKPSHQNSLYVELKVIEHVIYKDLNQKYYNRKTNWSLLPQIQGRKT